MYLYLFRHGIAEPGGPGLADRDRALTAEGVRMLTHQAAALNRMGLRIERLYASPYRRARQTAEVLAPALALSVAPDVLLAPGCTLADLDELVRRSDAAHVLIVGHQPYLGTLVRQLTGGVVAMRTGTLAVVEAERLRPRAGTLRGLYDPDVMAALGRSFSDQ